MEGAPAAGGGLYAPRTLQRRRPSRYHPHPRFPPPTHFPDSALQYTQASVQECSKAGYRNEAQARQDHVSPCVPPTPPPYTPPPSHSSQPSDLPCLLSCPLSPYSLLTASAPLSHAPAPLDTHAPPSSFTYCSLAGLQPQRPVPTRLRRRRGPWPRAGAGPPSRPPTLTPRICGAGHFPRLYSPHLPCSAPPVPTLLHPCTRPPFRAPHGRRLPSHAAPLRP